MLTVCLSYRLSRSYRKQVIQQYTANVSARQSLHPVHLLTFLYENQTCILPSSLQIRIWNLTASVKSCPGFWTTFLLKGLSLGALFLIWFMNVLTKSIICYSSISDAQALWDSVTLSHQGSLMLLSFSFCFLTIWQFYTLPYIAIFISLNRPALTPLQRWYVTTGNLMFH